MPRSPRDMQILRANAEVGDLKREVAELKALALGRIVVPKAIGTVGNDGLVLMSDGTVVRPMEKESIVTLEEFTRKEERREITEGKGYVTLPDGSMVVHPGGTPGNYVMADGAVVDSEQHEHGGLVPEPFDLSKYGPEGVKHKPDTFKHSAVRMDKKGLATWHESGSPYISRFSLSPLSNGAMALFSLVERLTVFATKSIINLGRFDVAAQAKDTVELMESIRPSTIVEEATDLLCGYSESDFV